jgi:hypothetical protein
MSSNESIFTTEPFPPSPRSMRQAKKRRNRIVRKVVLAIVAMTVGIGVGTAIVNSTEADAVSQATINKYIRANGGIPPCTHEDGSGQPGNCYWDASERGNSKGHDYIAVSQGPNKDKAIVFITGPKAKRY